MGFRRSVHRDLTRVGLMLAPQRRAGRGLGVAALFVAAAFAAGVGASELLREPVKAPVAALASGPSAEVVQLRERLEQASLALRVADARSAELEHQIDALNQKLSQSQDELTFFRKARESRKH
jgi:hypothetical protein